MSKNQRIIITGASGLLGRDLIKTFDQDSEWQTLGLAYSRVSERLRKCDLTDPQQVSSIIREFKPSVILHSAAERRPDVVEKQEDRTRGLNVTATALLCDLAKEVGAYVIYISTDYVFDGTSPPYPPTAAPNPLNKYGASKAEGEAVVMKASPSNMVVRVPILYGDVETLDESAVTTLFPKVKEASVPCVMNHHERRYPTLCADVGQAVHTLVQCRAKDPDLSGYFHFSGTEMMTKYDMAVAMAAVFGLPSAHIQADTSPSAGAPRPYDCQLDCSRLENLGANHRTPFKVGARQGLEKFL